MGVYCHLEHMQRELARPFKVLPASLKRIQLHFGQSVSEWYNALPRAAKSGHGQLKEKVSLLTTCVASFISLIMHVAVSMLVHKGMPLARVLCVLVVKSVWIDSSSLTRISNVQQQ